MNTKRGRATGRAVNRWPTAIAVDIASMAPGGSASGQIVQSDNYRLTIDRFHVELRSSAALDAVVENPRVTVTISNTDGAYMQEVPVCAIAGTKQFPMFLPVAIVVEPGDTLEFSFVNESAGLTYIGTLTAGGVQERVG